MLPHQILILIMLVQVQLGHLKNDKNKSLCIWVIAYDDGVRLVCKTSTLETQGV